MNGGPGKHPLDRSTQLAEQRTDLALQRTIIASERTLMAWIRTSISMIGFGFTIYKFFQYMEGEGVMVARPEAPRNLGLALIALGTVALMIAVWQHRDFLKAIGVTEARRMRSLTVIVSLLVVVIGVIAFIGVLARAGPF